MLHPVNLSQASQPPSPLFSTPEALTPDRPVQGSRRLKLWEVDHKCHCPIIGTCFSLTDIRQLVGRIKLVTADTSDFEIHVTAVRESETRNNLSQLLHKELERRYALYTTRFRQAKDSAALTQHWHQALRAGEVAGGLWATLTHPHCTARLAQEVYGEIHMLQHQIGATVRQEQRQAQALQREYTVLGWELASAQRRFSEFRDERLHEIAELKKQLAAQQAENCALNSQITQQQTRNEHLHSQRRELERLEQLQARQLQIEQENRQLRQQHAALQEENSQLRSERNRLENEILHHLNTHHPADSNDASTGHDRLRAALKGRSVLCVGGRTGSASLYRTLVEKLGGAFLHHDGGLEESTARLEASIAAADAVICQAGCISHNAYWRVKETCKRTGKTCVFLKSPSVSAFLNSLETLQEKLPENNSAAVPG